MRRVLLGVLAIAVSAGGSVSAGPPVPAHPNLAKYDFACTGTYPTDVPVAEVGIIQFTSSTTAIGSAHFNKGDINEFTTFNATILNGTADAQGGGGNGIPRGCFTGAAFFGGDTWGINSNFFGCLNHDAKGFDWVQNAGLSGTVTCRGTQM